MLPTDMPRFIDTVMEQIEIGIDRVAQRKLVVVEPPAGVDPPMVHVAYPEHVEMMINVDVDCLEPGTTDSRYNESQTIWVKIPWPKRIG